MQKHVQLALLFLFIVGVRLAIAAESPYLYDDSSYYHLRAIEGIISQENIREDPLTGRTHIISPFYDYILSFFSLFLPQAAVQKLIPNLFATSFVIVAYYISQTLTKDHYVSMLTASLSGFIPIYFASTFNHLTPYSLVLPLMGLLVYYFIHLERGYTGYAVTLVLLSLLHPSVLVFLLTLIMYRLILFIEDIKPTQQEQEIILFTLIFVIWSQLILYKRIFLLHSYNAFYQNIPTALLSRYFQDFHILEGIYYIDAVPFLFGLYAIRQYLFKIQDKSMYLLISLALTIGLLLWAKLIALNSGLMLLGMAMVLLFPKNYHNRLKLLSQSRMRGRIKQWKLFFLIFFMATAIGSSLHLAAATRTASTIEDEHTALTYLKENTKANTIILNDIMDSNKVLAIAERNTVIDDDFLMMKNSHGRYEEMERALTTPHITLAAEYLEKYHAEYIYLSKRARTRLGITSLPSANERCLPLIYNTSVQIYRWRCRLEVRS